MCKRPGLFECEHALKYTPCRCTNNSRELNRQLAILWSGILCLCISGETCRTSGRTDSLGVSTIVGSVSSLSWCLATPSVRTGDPLDQSSESRVNHRITHSPESKRQKKVAQPPDGIRIRTRNGSRKGNDHLFSDTTKCSTEAQSGLFLRLKHRKRSMRRLVAGNRPTWRDSSRWATEKKIQKRSSETFNCPIFPQMFSESFYLFESSLELWRHCSLSESSILGKNAEALGEDCCMCCLFMACCGQCAFAAEVGKNRFVAPGLPNGSQLGTSWLPLRTDSLSPCEKQLSQIHTCTEKVLKAMPKNSCLVHSFAGALENTARYRRQSHNGPFPHPVLWILHAMSGKNLESGKHTSGSKSHCVRKFVSWWANEIKQTSQCRTSVCFGEPNLHVCSRWFLCLQEAQEIRAMQEGRMASDPEKLEVERVWVAERSLRKIASILVTNRQQPCGENLSFLCM